MEYLRDPAAIYEQSFGIIRTETDLGALPPALAEIAVRLIHSCGMPDIVADLRWSEDVAASSRNALAGGASIICDSRMTATGIISRILPRNNQILCMIDLPNVAREAEAQRTTRSAAQVELWKPFLPGSLVAIGNAPTALFRLLDLIAEDPSRKPAAILGFPVGFVGASEAKAALHEQGHEVPYITLLGRRGGSAMAASAVNALASTGSS